MPGLSHVPLFDVKMAKQIKGGVGFWYNAPKTAQLLQKYYNDPPNPCQ